MSVLLLLMLAPAVASLGQDDKAAPKLAPAEITDRLAAVQASIAQSEDWLRTADPSLASDAKAQLLWLRKTEAAYQAQLTGMKRRASLHADLTQRMKPTEADVRQQLAKPPYNLSYYDRFLDERDAITQQKKACEHSIKMEARATEDARAQVESVKGRIRAAGENGGAVDAQLKLELQFAEAALEQHRQALENSRLELALIEGRSEAAGLRVDWIRRQIRFDAADLKTQLDKISARRKSHQERQEMLSADLHEIEKEWQALMVREENAETLRPQFELRRQARQKALEQTDNILQLINQEEQLWQHRYELLTQRPPQTTLQEWDKGLSTFMSGLNRLLEQLQEEQMALQPQIAGLYKELGAGDQGSGASRKKTILALSQQIRSSMEYHSELKIAQTLAERLSIEIGLSREKITPKDVLDVTWSWTRKVWNFELWVIDDHPVTVKKVLMAVVILIAGILLAKALMRSFVNHLERAPRINKNSIPIITKVVYYFLLILVVLFTLKTVRIPLTAFTFMGGALAIGIGFGAQNLLSNFISGFIIMMEQPIRIGDQVEMEGRVGIIKEIGARCTHMQTFDNIDIMVPNSFFLEKSIINRSKIDEMCRAKISVGVAYGSDTRMVENRLLNLAKANPLVLDEPAPFVLFQDFGSSTMDFELFIWVKLQDLARAPSEIRHAIASIFPREGIEIAFPQMDVHLRQA